MQKTKLYKSKKGFNDIFILFGFFSIILFSAVFIDAANAELGTEADSFNTDGTTNQLKEDVQNVSSFNAFSLIITALKLVLWDVGDTLQLPIIFDTFFTLIFVITIVLIGRNIWVGGGA